MKILSNRNYNDLKEEIRYLRNNQQKHYAFVKGLLLYHDIFKKYKIPFTTEVKVFKDEPFVGEEYTKTLYIIPAIRIVDVKPVKKKDKNGTL